MMIIIMLMSLHGVTANPALLTIISDSKSVTMFSKMAVSFDKRIFFFDLTSIQPDQSPSSK